MSTEINEEIRDQNEPGNSPKTMKAYQICLEMLSQRNYTIVEKEETYIIALKPNGEQMVVFFHENPKFDTKGMKETISLMTEMDIKHALIVYKEDVTSATGSTMERSIERRFELFAEEDLQYNITKHRLQPVFEKLSPEEALTFKKTHGLKFGTLRSDKPIARFYDYQKGDVIRIIRKDGYITYRIVKV